jgi:excisionase family DNA binding protein
MCFAELNIQQVVVNAYTNFYRKEICYMKNLLDVDDLAKYLKLQKQTIYNWLNQRKISGMKIGGVWRFDKQEVDKWLKSQSRRAKRRK